MKENVYITLGVQYWNRSENPAGDRKGFLKLKMSGPTNPFLKGVNP